jgi:hypothetical protein
LNNIFNEKSVTGQEKIFLPGKAVQREGFSSSFWLMLQIMGQAKIDPFLFRQSGPSGQIITPLDLL